LRVAREKIKNLRVLFDEKYGEVSLSVVYSSFFLKETDVLFCGDIFFLTGEILKRGLNLINFDLDLKDQKKSEF